MSKPWLQLASLVTLTLVSTQASAQTYRCVSGGTTYIADRPCQPVSPQSNKLVSVGSLKSPSTYTSSQSSYYRGSSQLEQAPAHQKYLSGACASMADAIRTAPTRGINYQVISDLRREYDQKCKEEDRLARTQTYEDERRESAEKVKQLESAKDARTAHAQVEAQCNAMREVLASKRAKFDSMTPGEKTNFQTLQSSFNDRCVKPH